MRLSCHIYDTVFLVTDVSFFFCGGIALKGVRPVMLMSMILSCSFAAVDLLMTSR